jgi:hypothetical protein
MRGEVQNEEGGKGREEGAQDRSRPFFDLSSFSFLCLLSLSLSLSLPSPYIYTCINTNI